MDASELRGVFHVEHWQGRRAIEVTRLAEDDAAIPNSAVSQAFRAAVAERRARGEGGRLVLVDTATGQVIDQADLGQP